MARWLTVVVAALGLAATAAASPPPGPNSLAWVAPQPPLANWKVLVPASGTSVLWYPPAMKQAPGDSYSVTAELRDPTGKLILVYLNAGPKTGNEQLATFASSRIDHLREEHSHAVRKDAAATGLSFHGGKGSCVIDDYITPRLGHHYKEVTCLVQGKNGASVIVAAALESAWPKYQAWLERAINAYQVR
jgi:hypothetical protein